MDKGTLTMTPTLPDLMKALDELQEIYTKIFDFMPLYDADQLTMQRALAVLHAHVKELNQP